MNHVILKNTTNYYKITQSSRTARKTKSTDEPLMRTLLKKIHLQEKSAEAQKLILNFPLNSSLLLSPEELTLYDVSDSVHPNQKH